MENILTLGKLLSLWFCFLLYSILFFISQTSYHTYTIISSYELARPIMGTIFLVSDYFLYIVVICMSYLIKEDMGYRRKMGVDMLGNFIFREF